MSVFSHTILSSMPPKPLVMQHFLFFKFIYFERVHAHARGKRAERERESKEAPPCQHRNPRGALTHEPWDYDPKQKSKSRTLNQLSHPGAPAMQHVLKVFKYCIWDLLLSFGCFSTSVGVGKKILLIDARRFQSTPRTYIPFSDGHQMDRWLKQRGVSVVLSCYQNYQVHACPGNATTAQIPPDQLQQKMHLVVDTFWYPSLKMWEK